MKPGEAENFTQFNLGALWFSHIPSLNEMAKAGSCTAWLHTHSKDAISALRSLWLSADIQGPSASCILEYLLMVNYE